MGQEVRDFSHKKVEKNTSKSSLPMRECHASVVFQNENALEKHSVSHKTAKKDMSLIYQELFLITVNI